MRNYCEVITAAAAIALSVAVALGSLGPDLLGVHGAWLRTGTLVIAVLLTSGAAAWLLARWYRALEQIRGYLNRLADTDLLEADPESVAVPPALYNPMWRGTLERLRDRWTQALERLRAAQRERSALEVRSRQSVAETQRLRRIVAQVPEPILVVNQFDEVLLANDAAQNLLWDGQTALETRILSQLENCQCLVDLLHDTRRRASPGTRIEEIELADPQGGVRIYRAAAQRLQSGDSSGDSDSGVVLVLRDVTDELAQRKRYAEFASSVSHEMKTPLAGIKAYVELLADGEVENDESREEFLEVINTQVDRLQRLIDNMLNLARIEAGVVKVNKDHWSLNDVLGEAACVVQPAAERKSIELSTELSPMYLGVYVDRDTMLQAVINLLSNAVKYTPAGGRVILRSRLEGDAVTFDVEDTGVGLSETDCRRVFEKFYRVRKDRDMAAGTGLGLSLVKHIVEDIHGGSVSVTSTLGEGSTFHVSLPLSRSAAPAAARSGLQETLS